MRLRIALIVLALVVTPAVVFAVAKSSSSGEPITSPGTAYVAVAKAPGSDVKAAVANYERQHPADTCRIEGNVAVCATDSAGQVLFIVAPGTSYLTSAQASP